MYLKKLNRKILLILVEKQGRDYNLETTWYFVCCSFSEGNLLKLEKDMVWLTKLWSDTNDM